MNLVRREAVTSQTRSANDEGNENSLLSYGNGLGSAPLVTERNQKPFISLAVAIIL